MAHIRSGRLGSSGMQSIRDAAVVLLLLLLASSVRITGNPEQAETGGVQAAEYPAVLQGDSPAGLESDTPETVQGPVAPVSEPGCRTAMLMTEHLEKVLTPEPVVELQQTSAGTGRESRKISLVVVKAGGEPRVFELDLERLKAAAEVLRNTLQLQIEAAQWPGRSLQRQLGASCSPRPPCLS